MRRAIRLRQRLEGLISAFMLHVATYGGATTVASWLLGYSDTITEWGAENRDLVIGLILTYFGLYALRYGFELEYREAKRWRDEERAAGRSQQ